MGTAVAEQGARTEFRVKAMSLEACSCAHGCNCQFAGYPNEGYCHFTIGYEVREGKFGNVDLSGVRFVIAAKYPNAIHEGNGHVALFVDEKASPDQVNAIAGILTAAHGGMPWEAIVTTVSKLEGPIQKPIDMKLGGPDSYYRIEGVLEVQAKSLKNPVTGLDNEVHITYPNGGFFWNDGRAVTTDTMRVTWGDLSFEYPAKFAAVAECNWTNAA